MWYERVFGLLFCCCLLSIYSLMGKSVTQTHKPHQMLREKEKKVCVYNKTTTEQNASKTTKKKCLKTNGSTFSSFYLQNDCKFINKTVRLSQVSSKCTKTCHFYCLRLRLAKQKTYDFLLLLFSVRCERCRPNWNKLHTDLRSFAKHLHFLQYFRRKLPIYMSFSS